MKQTRITPTTKPKLLDFFAGAGLVTEAVKPYFDVVWANDICAKKASVYRANHGAGHFHLGSIEDVTGPKLPPPAAIAWASFPCQDLSLAGAQAGITGRRSGMVWEWLRVIEEMEVSPPILVAENVQGLISSNDGAHYRSLHLELVARNYRVGAMLIDAISFLPQSRPRVFIVAVRNDIAIGAFTGSHPDWMHPESVVYAAEGLPDWVYWKMPKPAPRTSALDELLEWDAPVADEVHSKRVLSLIPALHQTRLRQELTNGFRVAPGYRRTRNGRQVLELRFDGVAGCLRTPEGGSSRQVLVLRRQGQLATRLLTARETARLMGVPERYHLPANYNEAYKAMGDAVAVPAVRHLARHLLRPLADLVRMADLPVPGIPK